jgi:SAM-dependent methyltransferase
MGRFASTVSLYEQFRQPYPTEFFRTVVQRLGVTKQQSLIDLGTGPGLLALGFAPFVGPIVGVDPEAGMLAAARAAAERAGQAFTLIEGKAEDLPEDVGRFDVLTIGRALHWMDPTRLAPLFHRLVAPGGVVLVCASTSASDGRNAWLDDYNAARHVWSDERLWSQSRHGGATHRDLGSVLAGTGFGVTDRIMVESRHEISVHDLAQRTLTFSSSSPAALGDKAGAMLADVEVRLRPFARDGTLSEVVLSIAQVAKRMSSSST